MDSVPVKSTQCESMPCVPRPSLPYHRRAREHPVRITALCATSLPTAPSTVHALVRTQHYMRPPTDTDILPPQTVFACMIHASLLFHSLQGKEFCLISFLVQTAVLANAISAFKCRFEIRFVMQRNHVSARTFADGGLKSLEDSKFMKKRCAPQKQTMLQRDISFGSVLLRFLRAKSVKLQTISAEPSQAENEI